jgi:hypothetical protein
MTDIYEIYRTIGNQHLRLGQSYLALAELLPNVEPLDDGGAAVEPIAEMTVHAPTEPCAPPSDDEPLAAEFAPDAEDVEPSVDGKSPKLYTAAQWVASSNFATYMKKAPYASWPEAKQIETRNAFVKENAGSPPRNRWGKAYAKFCGVNTKDEG